ncbi:MAG TPA: putative zinc-binding protein [Thermodesulfobacteriota bacterium]|nr:putative zinc-binding protein [Thermodesulfobacteriota bacterium]
MSEKPSSRRIGVIACCGEDLPEGTLTRAIVRILMEEIKPDETATICLPLFLAGDEQERTFAQRFPTLTLDGCEKRCAQIGTEKYSHPVARGLIIPDILRKLHLEMRGTREQFDLDLARAVAIEVAKGMDRLKKKGGIGEKEGNKKEGDQTGRKRKIL